MTTNPPPVPLSNATLVFRSLYGEVCAAFNSNKRDEARDLAWTLYQEAALPKACRAGCCVILATGDGGDYLAFAREGVALFQEILVSVPSLCLCGDI